MGRIISGPAVAVKKQLKPLPIFHDWFSPMVD
jgi:hypothetical protein